MGVKASVEQQFGAAAERYAGSRFHRTGPDLDRMLEEARPGGGERVLDVGTGAGHTALAFAERGCAVTAIDLTAAMLEQGRALAAERGLEIRFERADAEALPFPDASFDLVTCRVCAHHFLDPQAALHETARVLRPGGLFLLSDSVAPEDPAGDTFVNTYEVLRDPSHVRNYSVSQWLAMGRAARLDLDCVLEWRLELDFDAWIARMGTPPEIVSAIRAHFRASPVRTAFGLETGDEPCFQLPMAVFRGVPA